MSPSKTVPRIKPVNLPQVNSLMHAWGKGIFYGILIAIILATVCGPATAQPPPVSGGGFGKFNLGVPVYWPYHALLMTTGFVLLVAGFFIARFRKTETWYKTHMILEAVGGACILAGLFVGIYMVTLSGLPHLRNTHELAGVAAGILVIITITIGYLIKRINKSKNVIRISHRWLGRISIVLVAINIVLGLLLLSVILRR
jgi:hypothetical protein